MSKWIKWLVLANLVAIAVLVFAYPRLMVSPGRLQPAHNALETDCFACHAPLLGASSSRCMDCHRPADIGRVTTMGTPLANSTPLHQSLTRQDCMACHHEHADRLVPIAGTVTAFDHSLLRAEDARECKACHQAPDTKIHTGSSAQCSQCHRSDAWLPASFDHATLSVTERANCSACHVRPLDSLHRAAGDSCGQCHRTDAWKPATFDHDRYFPLVGDHRTTCATCHPRNDTSRYTCYGCHEHTPAGIRAEHLEEGIRNFEDCAQCHGPRARRATGSRRGGDDD